MGRHRKHGGGKKLRVGESRVGMRRVDGKMRKVRITRLGGGRERVRVVNPKTKRGVTRRGGFPDKYGPGRSPTRPPRPSLPEDGRR